ncbi:hypothetical protein [Sanguibacter sp. 25GB23B1]|uniref:hypothetical protein n=1 Tax=unclassified Sanguibacter TaxID=2645534 RepID=UPI0032AF2AD0
MSRRSRPLRFLRGLVVVGAVGALAVGGIVLLLDRTVPGTGGRETCSADLDGTSWSFSPVQADNAALITAVTVRRGMPARAATIGLATALQESKLVNIDYGDRDSVGLFQQRTSQGWGTIEQIMDPVYSTNAFYDGLDGIAGYTELPITEAAQAVQRSGFPDAYAQHENRSRAWASALTGHSTGAVTCTLDRLEGVDLDDEAGTSASLDTLRARVVRDFGDLPVTADPVDGSVVVEVGPLTPAPEQQARVSWAVAQWGVATARATAVDTVLVGDQVWTRETRAWTTVEDTDAHAPAGTVRLRLAAA